jgi:hypothetical protein
VTERYATEIVRDKTIRHVGMHFLNRYIQFLKTGERTIDKSNEKDNIYDPLMTKAAIEGNQLNGLYFIDMMFVTHKSFSVEKVAQENFEILTEYTRWLREITIRMFGGFRFNAWFNDVVGITTKNAFLDAGQKYFRGDDNVKAIENSRFLLCVTRNQSVSRRLGIPDNVNCHLQLGNWFYNVFAYDNTALTNLNTQLKHVGSLILLRYSKKQIAQIIFATETAAGIPQDKLERRVAAKFRDIGKHLKKAEIISQDTIVSQQVLEITLLNHPKEVRPVIVHHYPNPIQPNDWDEQRERRINAWDRGEEKRTSKAPP